MPTPGSRGNVPVTRRNSSGFGETICGLRYTGATVGNGGDCSVVVSAVGGGGGSGLFAGLGSRGGGRKGPVDAAGEASRNMPSGVSRPDLSLLGPRGPCLREPPLIKVPRLVLLLCPRSSVIPVVGPWADDVLLDIPPAFPDISSTRPPVWLDWESSKEEIGNKGILSKRSTSRRAYDRASATHAKESRLTEIVLPVKSID